MSTSATLDRPRRWDAPFSDDMEESEVRRILSVAPFRDMRADSFPRSAPLPEIIRNDCRVRSFRKGEIIVREGDYGTSAFLILKGHARVVLGPELPASQLGRRERSKRGILRSIAKFLTSPREDEVTRDGKGRSILKKDAHIILQDVPRILDKHRTATMEAGDFFGEIAALSRIPRTATIFAAEDHTELLEIRWQGLRDLMRNDTALRLHIDNIYRERALRTYLEEIPFLQHLGEEDKKAVMAATQFETYGDYDWSGEYKKLIASGASAAKEQTIAAEDTYPNGIIMVRAGFARLTQRYGDGHRTLNYLGSGGIYGFEEIAHNWRRPEDTVELRHSLRVIGYTHVLVIPAAIIERHVLPSLPKDLLPPLIETAPGETAAPVDSKASSKITADSDLMEFLTENRLFNGTETMVIDLDRCTRCDDCVRACAATHDNNPRFLRHGPIHDRLMVAQACMHCADPICMIGCPTGAIHRDSFEGNVVINPSTCIGCSACANNCPYGAIRMTEARDTDGEILVASDFRPILKATKCDLCLDQNGGPACERACPHDALKRMNLNTLDELLPWLRR